MLTCKLKKKLLTRENQCFPFCGYHGFKRQAKAGLLHSFFKQISVLLFEYEAHVRQITFLPFSFLHKEISIYLEEKNALTLNSCRNKELREKEGCFDVTPFP